MKELKEIILTFRTTKEEKERIKDFALTKGLSVSELMREALRNYMGIK